MDFEEALAAVRLPREQRSSTWGRSVVRGRAEPISNLQRTGLRGWVRTLLMGVRALGEYLLTKGNQVGCDETLNQFAYPRVDRRGPQDGAWLAAAIEEAEGLLADVRLDLPEG
jgi:hypothetical protein